jgi:hypothetical protein
VKNTKPTTTAHEKLLLHMPHDPAGLKGKDLIVRRLPFIAGATEFSVKHCGRNAAVAHAKWTRVLHGLKSPCTLVDPEIYVASLTNWCQANGAFLDPIQGYLRLPQEDGSEIRVALPVDASGEPLDQHLFLVAVKRYGQAQLGDAGLKKFWSYTLVSLEAEVVGAPEPGSGLFARIMGAGRPKPEGMAFTYALDAGLNKDGQLLFEASQVYFKREDDVTRASGRKIVDDRTNGLTLPCNLLAIATACAKACGFPFEETRVNRRTNSERQEARLNAQARFGSNGHAPLLSRG